MGFELNWRGALVTATMLYTGSCLAEEGPQVTGDKSYVSCLTPAPADRGSPEYPEHQLFSKNGGVVQVALTFTGKDSPPRVKILNRNQWNEEAFDAFSRSVERFASKYRLPCLTEGTAELRQDFRFSPDARKAFALDTSDAPSEMVKSECKFEYSGSKPSYPWGSQRPYGNVYVTMKFMQRDEAPIVTVVYGGGHYLLAETTKSWMEQYRLRCAKPIENPVESTHLHRFTPEGGAKVSLKDMAFVPFLQSIDRKSLGKPKFDFQSMACPFDVKVTLLQPHAPNVVRELERTEPNRKDFLKWLTALVFRYPDGYERFLVGETMTVAVPCMALDLT